MWRSAFRVAAATAAFAVTHSGLASSRAKAAAARVVGERRRDAWYRPTFNVVAVATSAALVAYIRRQPDRELYDVRGPGRWLMRFGQAAALAGMAEATWRAGPAHFAGLPGLWAWLRGRRVPRMPEGQNPDARADGTYPAEGVFAATRNPTNFFPVPLLWLNPRMTANLATFAAVSTAYFVVGSVRTDRRLCEAYGAAYEAYRRRVPLFVPGVRSAPRGRQRGVAPQLLRRPAAAREGGGGEERGDAEGAGFGGEGQGGGLGG